MSQTSVVPFLFVVDTREVYAGSFQEAMTAFMCGVWDGYGTAKKAGELYQREVDRDDDCYIWLNQNVVQNRDSDGYNYASVLYFTPNLFNAGMGIHYSQEEWDQDSESIVQRYQAAVKEQNKKYPGMKVDQFQPAKLPAVCSIAICLAERPDQEIIDFLKERAQGFADRYAEIVEPKYLEKITITGYRLVEQVVVTKEQAL